ncbi:hypothetical protein B7C42_01665 [Nocardia cerradoensis]|uniref:Uncharacterized protein n=1 Tax=Nocardia cerradoensis TaxID=85688 RepID=A0A231HCR2_9NOCA|nr:hypothetical protein [Nocardia cerradoensis]OXR46690.1 hypothetical protein B7C42_01665 [Nocardia cerradoensis]
MSVALRGTATAGTTTITPDATVVAGDLLVVAAIAPSATTITVPAGWTTLRSVTTSNSSSTLRLVIAYRLLVAGDPSSWTLTGATYNICAAYSGCDPTTPILAENFSSAAASSITTPTLSNTNSGAWRVAAWGIAEVSFSSVSAWSTFSPADTRRAHQEQSKYALALTDSAATVATGSTSITGTSPTSQPSWACELAWIGLIQPLLSTPVSSSDTGAGAETAAVRPADTETAAGTDTAAVKATSAVSQTGSATDTASVRPGDTDTAAGTEASALAVQAADTATVTDSATVVVQAPETGTAVDTAIGTSGTPVTDPATGTESSSIATRGSDTGTAADTAGVVAAEPSADTGAAADSATVSIDQQVADVASTSESALVKVGIPSTDTASGLESARITQGDSDTATARDSATARHAGAAVPARLHFVEVLPRLPVWTGPGQ